MVAVGRVLLAVGILIASASAWLGAPSRDGIAKPACAAPEEGDMVWIPPGETLLGSSRFGPEEQPVRRERAPGFWIDRYEVTNGDFAAFVNESGYVTLAERPPVWPKNVDVPPDLRVPGGIVFRSPSELGVGHPSSWWQWVPGANWRQPEGPGSSIEGRDHYPVLHVAHEDAVAYARWKGHMLPTEAMWERAARGDAEGRDYVWGDEPYPNGRHMADGVEKVGVEVALTV